MSIFNRIKTNVQADAHGLIDALEDRRLLLKQCVRDAEAELHQERATMHERGDADQFAGFEAELREQRAFRQRDDAVAIEPGEPSAVR